ncbi:hypothetical protein E2C01_019151 [Portunus trituberculatus]|uniref:Uncharacterized protein n=1 Tax=Portunus trituberculatus TaxID=210409 RepID=A0A5B7DYG8_PORTR|nr:hypothetical protein [Portunus trituberculatus]
MNGYTRESLKALRASTWQPYRYASQSIELSSAPHSLYRRSRLEVLLSLAELIGCLIRLHRLLLVAQTLLNLSQQAVGVHCPRPHRQELSKVAC